MGSNPTGTTFFISKNQLENKEFVCCLLIYKNNKQVGYLGRVVKALTSIESDKFAQQRSWVRIPQVPFSLDSREYTCLQNLIKPNLGTNIYFYFVLLFFSSQLNLTFYLSYKKIKYTGSLFQFLICVCQI